MLLQLLLAVLQVAATKQEEESYEYEYQYSGEEVEPGAGVRLVGASTSNHTAIPFVAALYTRPITKTSL